MVIAMAYSFGSKQYLDIGVCILHIAGGAVGTALWDFCSAHYKDELVVCGTKGALSMSIFGKGK